MTEGVSSTINIFLSLSLSLCLCLCLCLCRCLSLSRRRQDRTAQTMDNYYIINCDFWLSGDTLGCFLDALSSVEAVRAVGAAERASAAELRINYVGCFYRSFYAIGFFSIICDEFSNLSSFRSVLTEESEAVKESDDEEEINLQAVLIYSLLSRHSRAHTATHTPYMYRGVAFYKTISYCRRHFCDGFNYVMLSVQLMHTCVRS